MTLLMGSLLMCVRRAAPWICAAAVLWSGCEDSAGDGAGPPPGANATTSPSDANGDLGVRFPRDDGGFVNAETLDVEGVWISGPSDYTTTMALWPGVSQITGELVHDGGVFALRGEVDARGLLVMSLRARGCLGSPSAHCEASGVPSHTLTLRAVSTQVLSVDTLTPLDVDRALSPLDPYLVPHDGFKPENGNVLDEGDIAFLGRALAFAPGQGADAMLNATCELVLNLGEATVASWRCGEQGPVAPQAWEAYDPASVVVDGERFKVTLNGSLGLRTMVAQVVRGGLEAEIVELRGVFVTGTVDELPSELSEIEDRAIGRLFLKRLPYVAP